MLYDRRRWALRLFGRKKLKEVVKEVHLAAVVERVWLALRLLSLLLTGSTVRQGSQGRPRFFALAAHHE